MSVRVNLLESRVKGAGWRMVCKVCREVMVHDYKVDQEGGFRETFECVGCRRILVYRLIRGKDASSGASVLEPVGESWEREKA